MRVETTWDGGSHFTAHGGNGYPMEMDTRVERGGTGKGLTPMEALLAAVAGCTGMDAVVILKANRHNIKRLNIVTEGVRHEDEEPKRFKEITVTFEVDGEVPANKVWRALHLSHEKYCSVSASLNAEVIYKLRLNGQLIPDSRRE